MESLLTDEKPGKAGRKPDWKARIEMPCWVEKDKLGREYLSCRLFGESVRIFRERPKEAQK